MYLILTGISDSTRKVTELTKSLELDKIKFPIKVEFNGDKGDFNTPIIEFPNGETSSLRHFKFKNE